KFFLYTLAGSVFMLLAFIWFYLNCDPTYLVDGQAVTRSFSITELARVGWAMKGHTILGIMAVKGILGGLFVGFALQIPTFPVPHVAARRARRGADGDQRHSCRRAPQAWELRHPAHQLRPLARGDGLGRAGDGGLRRGEHPVRRLLRDGAEGSEEARGLLLGQ